jgi:ATP-dependent Clp protease adapter protein ClpS
MTKEDVDLSNLLERAEVDAQRRRHDTVDPVHLLSVILEEEAVERALSIRGLHPAEVHDALEAVLTERPIKGGFRDVVGSAGGIVRSPALECVLERLAQGASLFSFGQPMTVLDALLLDRDVAKVVVSLRQCDGARHVLERATALAVVWGHSVITVAHVVKVLLDNSWFIDVLARTTTSADHLQAKLNDALMQIEPPSEGGSSKKSPSWVTGIIDVLRTVPNDTLSKMTLEYFCIALTREAATRHALEKLKIDPFAVLYSVVHEDSLPDPMKNLGLNERRKEQVLLYNDRVTPQSFARRVLEAAFGTAPYNAEDLVRVMIAQGQVALESVPTEEARANWKHAQKMCRKEMYPLRISVRKAT